jgi:hypothetical protein
VRKGHDLLGESASYLGRPIRESVFWARGDTTNLTVPRISNCAIDASAPGVSALGPDDGPVEHAVISPVLKILRVGISRSRLFVDVNAEARFIV